MRLLYLLLIGCQYSHGTTTGDAGSDGMRDGSAKDVADARECFGSGLDTICLMPPPSTPLTLSGTIDTSNSPDCLVTMFGPTEVCVIAGTTVDILGSTSYRGIGSRPLVIVAADVLTVAGTLDVSSPRGMQPGAGATSATCPSLGPPENDDGGAGGGAGGSFGGMGGNGGIGDTNDNCGAAGPGSGGTAAAAFTTNAVRAGCGGGSGGNGGGAVGVGGAGGGAVYLIAGSQINVSGLVVAAGGGGGGANDPQSGGGGGGSGGFVGLDAPALSLTGTVAANGGGGGEGSGLGSSADGNPGFNGTADATRAAGGSGGDTEGGNGGAGSGGATLTGDPGADNYGGGGGGGGGAGIIYVKGTLSGGTISPSPTPG